MSNTEKNTVEKKERKSFWETVPGILTALAALVTAIGGCITAIVAWPRPNVFFPATPTPIVFTSTPIPSTITSVPPALTPMQATALPLTTMLPLPATIQDVSAWPIILYSSFDDSINWFNGYQNEPNYTGSWLITDSKYRWEIKALQNFIQWRFFSAPEVLDFSLTVEVKQISGSRNSSYGVIFRSENNENFYFFRVSDSQGFGLDLLYNSKWEHLIEWTKTSIIKPGDTNLLTVTAQGSHFYFYINNQFVGEINDSTLTKGKVGLTIVIDNIGDTVVLEFDNFELRAP
jgi:hypothetical protein